MQIICFYIWQTRLFLTLNIFFLLLFDNRKKKGSSGKDGRRLKSLVPVWARKNGGGGKMPVRVDLHHQKQEEREKEVTTKATNNNSRQKGGNKVRY